MHTYRGKTARFHVNGDFSGNVRVVMPSALANAELQHNPPGETQSISSIQVPYADLEYLVLERFRGELIEEIEGIDLKTPRGRWIMFKYLAAFNDVPKTSHAQGYTPRGHERRETGTGGSI